MKDAQRPDHPSLGTMVTRLREGRFVIPDFQRDFEWVPWDISALMRSLFRDCYIGSLLRLPRRIRLSSSRNVTSNLKCNPVSIPQCERATG